MQDVKFVPFNDTVGDEAEGEIEIAPPDVVLAVHLSNAHFVSVALDVVNTPPPVCDWHLVNVEEVIVQSD